MIPPITITDHAVLRWLERVEGVDVKAIRKRIAAAARKGAIHGASAVRLDGVQFCLQYNDEGSTTVATVFSGNPRVHLAVKRTFDNG